MLPEEKMSNISKILRQFRFQKQSGPKLPKSSNEPINSRAIGQEFVNGDKNEDGNSNKNVEQNDDCMYVDSDSSSDLKVPVPSESVVLPDEKLQKLDSFSATATAEEEDDMTSKEKSIQILEDALPHLDKMMIQDALIASNWDVDLAMTQLCPDDNASHEKRSRDHLKENSPPHKKARIANENEIEEERIYEENEDDDHDVNVCGRRVFDSDESDDEISDVLTQDKQKVLDYLSTSTIAELRAMPNCSQKRAEAIIQQRPFLGWRDVVEKFQRGKFLGTHLLNSAQDVLDMREDVQNLMTKCLKIATQMEQAVVAGRTRVKDQPYLLTPGLSLAGYQMVGLNWFLVMHAQKLNGILADEMGLGKTIQVIAFLAHLKEKEMKEEGLLHLVIVPSSTLENWSNEFKRWCPTLQVFTYYGSPDERRAIRVNWMRDGVVDIDIILSTYSIVNSSPEEKKMFRILPLEYVILDEAHMLKNMTTQRYENLSRINARHRILLTGTPVQNNLLELMSLLIFVMPKMFAGKKDQLKTLFSKIPKRALNTTNEDQLPKFEQEQVAQARRIMKPFLLRRLKSEVLKDLPKKTDETVLCALAESQREKYDQLIHDFSESASQNDTDISGMAMMMELRKMANHPLLLRYHYTDERLREMAAHLAKDPLYKQDNSEYIFDDLAIMSDFQLHKLSKMYKSLSQYYLTESLFFESGKFQKFDEVLPDLKANDHRVLIFSQFVLMLDVMEVYLSGRGHQFVRLDGSTPVTSRQELIDSYNKDPSIFVFLLSTRAGGTGINLTAADTVIIHDIDFNPYNDKQAADRCHRVGQTRNVSVLRLISAGTIEEGIREIAHEKLTLEQEINNSEDNETTETKNVVCLLKQALGLDSARAANLLASEEQKAS